MTAKGTSGKETKEDSQAVIKRGKSIPRNIQEDEELIRQEQE